MQEKPVHKDISIYGYDLSYSKSRGRWYASCDTCKGAAWYVWSGASFGLICYSKLPDDLA